MDLTTRVTRLAAVATVAGLTTLVVNSSPVHANNTGIINSRGRVTAAQKVSDNVCYSGLGDGMLLTVALPTGKSVIMCHETFGAYTSDFIGNTYRFSANVGSEGLYRVKDITSLGNFPTALNIRTRGGTWYHSSQSEAQRLCPGDGGVYHVSTQGNPQRTRTYAICVDRYYGGPSESSELHFETRRIAGRKDSLGQPVYRAVHVR